MLLNKPVALAEDDNPSILAFTIVVLASTVGELPLELVKTGTFGAVALNKRYFLAVLPKLA